MRIKKHKNDEYIRAGDVWVRNFTKPYTETLGISRMIHQADYKSIILNETINTNMRYGNIAEEKKLKFKKALIISDGYDFKTKHHELLDFPEDVFVFAVNGSLRRWELMKTTRRRPINAYVINNPYPESMQFLPIKDSRYYPACVGSIRTYSEFLKKYAGNVYVYEPVPEKGFGTEFRKEKYHIDDYRNPVCAAIGLAYQFGVQKLMLMCCDDSFKERRPAAEQLDNGLWAFPQHLRSQEIIDANLYWLTHDEQDKMVAADYSSGAKYANATYIKSKDEALAFFEDSKEEKDETIVTA